MPGRHQQSSFVARNRPALIVGVVLLCVAGALTVIANRRGPGSSLPVTPAPGGSSPPPLSASPSRSPSASPSPTRPAPPRASNPAAFAASYVAVRVRRSTAFQAGIVVTNEGRTPRTWRLVIRHHPGDGVRVQGSSGARMTLSGSTITFEGGPLWAGKSITVGYQATATTRGSVRPASCRVEGTSCEVSERRDRNESRAGRR